jgi:hypothetical protein
VLANDFDEHAPLAIAFLDRGTHVLLGGERVPRMDEGSARVVAAFRATIERGDPPLVPVVPAIEASLVGLAGAESLAQGSRPVALPGQA